MIPAEDYVRIFRRLPGIHLVLKANPPHFTILDFNDERATATNSSHLTAIGKDLFVRFPDNPSDPGATGVRNLRASLMRVIETKQPHKMSLQKYDIPIRGTDRFEERYWLPENIPVIGESGKVEYIIHTAVDVTSTILLEEKQKKAEIEIANLSLVLSKTQNAVVLADSNENVQWVNKSFTDLLELDDHAVVGKSFLTLLKRLTNANTHCDLEKSLALRQAMECEIENTAHNGNWNFAKLEIQPIFSTTGNLTAFFAMMTDLSDIKMAETTIIRNEVRNKFILSNISDGIIIMNSSGDIKEVSPSGLRILECGEAELISKFRSELVHPDDRVMVTSALREISSNDSKKTIQFRFKMPDGGYKWLESTFHNFFNEPTIHGVVITYRDISERKRQEELLQASERNYKYLFDNNPAAIFIWDPKTFQAIECNKAAEQLTGYTKYELKSMTVFNYRPAEEHEKIRSIPGKLEKVASLNSTPSLLTTRKGENLHIDSSYHKIKFYGQDLILALILNVDEKVKLQQAIELEKNRKHFEVTDAVLTAQENERAHLGRELHDNINQILTTARLYMEHALDEDKMRLQLMETSRDFIITAIKEVRELSKSLVPTFLEDNGLINAVDELIKKVRQLTTIEISTNYYINEMNLSGKFRLALFRIVQEQLNNIVKHSGASIASVIIKQSSKDLILIIRDNGVGFDVNAKRDGLGFKNIISRATLHGGVTSIQSNAGRGCELKIKFINQFP